MRPPQNQRRILTPAEKESLQRQISDHKEDTGTPIDRNLYTPDRVDDPLERASIARAKRVLKNGEPDSLNRAEKQKMEEANKVDVDWLQKNMVPRSHVNARPGPDQNDFRKAVNEMATKENSREFQLVAQRVKNRMRSLHPNDPHLSNLESIRPETR